MKRLIRFSAALAAILVYVGCMATLDYAVCFDRHQPNRAMDYGFWALGTAIFSLVGAVVVGALAAGLAQLWESSK